MRKRIPQAGRLLVGCSVVALFLAVARSTRLLSWLVVFNGRRRDARLRRGHVWLVYSRYSTAIMLPEEAAAEACHACEKKQCGRQQ